MDSNTTISARNEGKQNKYGQASKTLQPPMMAICQVTETKPHATEKERKFTHISGFGDSDFDDDMYDFDMESAVRDDPLSADTLANDNVQELSSKTVVASRLDTCNRTGAGKRKPIPALETFDSVGGSTCTSGSVFEENNLKQSFKKIKTEKCLESTVFDDKYHYEPTLKDKSMLKKTQLSKTSAPVTENIEIRPVLYVDEKLQVAKPHGHSPNTTIKLEQNSTSNTLNRHLASDVKGVKCEIITEQEYSHTESKQSGMVKLSDIHSLREQYFQMRRREKQQFSPYNKG